VTNHLAANILEFDAIPQTSKWIKSKRMNTYVLLEIFVAQ